MEIFPHYFTIVIFFRIKRKIEKKKNEVERKLPYNFPFKIRSFGKLITIEKLPPFLTMIKYFHNNRKFKKGKLKLEKKQRFKDNFLI